MKTLRFGIEIETVGLSRMKLAQAIHSVVGGTITVRARCSPPESRGPRGYASCSSSLRREQRGPGSNTDPWTRRSPSANSSVRGLPRLASSGGGPLRGPRPADSADLGGGGRDGGVVRDDGTPLGRTSSGRGPLLHGSCALAGSSRAEWSGGRRRRGTESGDPARTAPARPGGEQLPFLPGAVSWSAAAGPPGAPWRDRASATDDGVTQRVDGVS